MTWKNTDTQYGLAMKACHWLVALLILTQIILGIGHDYVSREMVGTVMMLHKSIGLLLLPLAVLFILVRLMNKKPQWPTDMPVHERAMAWFVHVSLYALILLMPLSGWIMSSASGHIPQFFNLVAVPFPFFGLNKVLAGIAHEAHEIMAWMINGIVILHVLGALKHHFVDKNDILKRML